MTDVFGARCIFCNETSRLNRRLMFIASEHKIGRVKDKWGLCHKCLAKAMAQFVDTLEVTG